MSDTFTLSGSYGTAPTGGCAPSGFPVITTPISESVTLGKKHVDEVTLSADAPVVVSFGGVTNAHVVVLKTVGGKVKVTVTSADGASQSFPVDTFLSLISLSVPITAISLTRVAGTSTKVEIFLGEKAT